ncbi:ATPase [Methanospirillum hungatei JF-1]|uniref:ATPase n=1 Tax=Methanospirillum hungatei JF-1 (strain ATCC 27890 / DSM 864 / NBRC 100397 / JF-1) TaxID=323259 RepID=Q2FNV6_METHJ|nr:ATP-binding protein [Methanospirillum hungatei]ABD41268.1 ATPase [Methanospirillum hungatei JF-1]
MFIDRKTELSALIRRFHSEKAELVILYGRRRVGKSELTDQFISQVGGIRLLAREESKHLQLKRISSELAGFFQDDYLLHAPFPDWDAFFVYLTKRGDKRVVIAIDEFPYLVQEDSSLPSLLQYYWDTALGKTHLYLILSGSSIGLVESQLMQYKSPLYGRRTGQILLKPFRFIDFYPYVNDLRTAIILYAIFGGTPAYCLIDEPFLDLEEIVCENLLMEDAFLYRDVEFVLRMELKEPRYYYSILLSIASGNTTIGLIANDCGLEKGLVSKYLATLADLQLIRRETPVLSGSVSRKGVYLLNDNLFSFWFRFVYPYRKEIEMGESKYVYRENIAPQLSQYIGRRFEEIILDVFYLFNSQGLFPVRFSDIGRWWYKEQEIDLVAVDPKSDTILFCECKWQDNVHVEKIVQSLKKKAVLVKWGTSYRKEIYCVIGRSCVPYQEDETIIFYDLDDLEKMIRACLNPV